MGTSIKPAIGSPNDRFGWAVAISSDTEVLAVGAPGFINQTDNIGRVHPFEFDYAKNDWVAAGEIINGSDPSDDFGYSTCLSDSGSLLAVGSPGWNGNTVRVYVFQRRGDKWERIGEPIEGKAVGDRLGHAVSLSGIGDIVAVGADSSDVVTQGRILVNAGVVRVYQYNMNKNQWEQLGQDLNGMDSFDRFGYTVSLDSKGRKLAIGAPHHGKHPANEDWWAGQVHVFTFNSRQEQWDHFGDPIPSQNEMDRFGFSVKLSANGQLLAVGAPWSSSNGEASGQLQEFRYNSEKGDWEGRGGIIQGPNLGRWFGNSVIMSRDGHTVGASLWGDHPKQPSLDSGGLYLYRFDAFDDKVVDASEGLPGQTMYNPESTSIALSGDGTIVMAAKNFGANTGVVRAYTPV